MATNQNIDPHRTEVSLKVGGFNIIARRAPRMNSSPLPLRAVLLVSIIAVTYAQAPDGHCCVALYGTNPVVEACAFCATLENFVCRSSVSPWTGSVSSTSVDCVSFAFANETACLAAPGAQQWITSSNFSGAGCPKTVTAYPSPPPTPPPPHLHLEQTAHVASRSTEKRMRMRIVTCALATALSAGTTNYIIRTTMKTTRKIAYLLPIPQLKPSALHSA